MLDPLSIGLQLGATALSAYGQNQQAKAQADYEYKMARRQTKLENLNRTNQYLRDIETQKRQWSQDLMIRGAKNQQSKAQIQANMMAAGRGYNQEYERIAEGFENARFQGQNNLIAMIQNQGKSAAAGRTGRGVANKDTMDAVRMYGQRQTMLANNLSRSMTAADRNMEDIRRKTDVANMNAWRPVSTPLMRPMAIQPPTLQSMPTRRTVSDVGMYSSMLGAAGTAFGQWSDLQPPTSS